MAVSVVVRLVTLLDLENEIPLHTICPHTSTYYTLRNNMVLAYHLGIRN